MIPFLPEAESSRAAAAAPSGRRCRARWLPVPARLLAAAALAAGLSRPAPVDAHSGPPFQVVEPTAAGPYTVEVWADPDIGTATVLVQLSEPAGAGPQVTVTARPLDGHRGEATVPARRSDGSGGISTDTWVAALPFDAPGTWALKVALEGPEGSGELSLAVDAVPDGPSLADAWLYALPFLLLGGAWLLGRWRARGEAAAGAAG